MAGTNSIPHARALEIQEDMAAWMTSKAALPHFYAGWSDVFHSIRNFRQLPLAERSQVLRGGLPSIIAAEHAAMAGTTPTFCSSEYGLMLATMAVTAPPNVISESDLPADEGVLIFEDPVTIEASDGPAPLVGIRAVSWHRFPSAANNWLVVRVWTEHKSPTASQVPGRTKLFARGIQVSNLGNTADRTFDYSLVRLLQSHFALLKSPMTVDEATPRNPKTSPRTKRSLAVDAIRRVYLRHPEHAQYEAEEVAAAREGRAPVRAHWVRGHWRNQPYPKTGEVKGIWIDGYIKGNPENGTVSTPKLMVARASTAEVRELVGAAA